MDCTCITNPEEDEQLLADTATKEPPTNDHQRLLANLVDSKKYSISYKTILQLTEADKEWTFGLVKSNMEHHYRQSKDMGWSESSKRHEMTEAAARYLILADISNPLHPKQLGFVHFRYTTDDDVDAHGNGFRLAVVYCYEIQLEPCAQKQGLGRILMTAMESLGSHYLMRKSKLTVFKHNTSAMEFYKRIGYTVDVTSPSMHMSAKRATRVSYEILSRRLSLE
ncbi:hypothetical protein BASA62_006967 [Batrachochytrium salamandrivorans]|nr:hypothetical protein BASA62_006967 [Batrachochytrium salamandrivorans]